ncbi:MAG TPA: heavy metal-binding domain-containing protein [Herpetosiphonaceae bacterium]
MTDSASASIIDPRMIATTVDLPGFRLVRGLGIAYGIGLRYEPWRFGARSAPDSDQATLVRIAVDAREAALAMLARHAATKGANAVVDLRFAISEFSENEELKTYEVLAYGTAVVAEPAG